MALNQTRQHGHDAGSHLTCDTTRQMAREEPFATRSLLWIDAGLCARFVAPPLQLADVAAARDAPGVAADSGGAFLVYAMHESYHDGFDVHGFPQVTGTAPPYSTAILWRPVLGLAWETAPPLALLPCSTRLIVIHAVALGQDNDRSERGVSQALRSCCTAQQEGGDKLALRGRLASLGPDLFKP